MSGDKKLLSVEEAATIMSLPDITHRDAVSLRDFLDRISDERKGQAAEMWDSHKDVHRALELAVQKADHLREMRDMMTNEWRGALTDQAKTYAKREDVEIARRDAMARADALSTAYSNQLSAMRDNMDRQMDALKQQLNDNREDFVKVIGAERDQIEKQVDTLRDQGANMRADLANLNGRLYTVGGVLLALIALTTFFQKLFGF